MCVFFILMGFTAGLFVASFTLGKNRFLSVVLPALSASAVVNSNHLIDQGYPTFNADQTEWEIYGWTVVDTKITALGYMLDGN